VYAVNQEPAGTAIHSGRFYERGSRPCRRIQANSRRQILQADYLRSPNSEAIAILRLTTPGATRAGVRARAEAKIADIDAKINNLKAMRSTLQKLIAGCQGSGPLKECPILESLNEEDV
jgi:hypothetical protein